MMQPRLHLVHSETLSRQSGWEFSLSEGKPDRQAEELLRECTRRRVLVTGLIIQLKQLSRTSSKSFEDKNKHLLINQTCSCHPI